MLTPIVNVLSIELYDRWKASYLDHVTGQRPDLVTAHKRALGPQDRCFQGWVRYWVWEDEEAGWSVSVSNKKGIGFEVRADFEPDAALAAWENYLKRFYPNLPGKRA